MRKRVYIIGVTESDRKKCVATVYLYEALQLEVPYYHTREEAEAVLGTNLNYGG